MKRILYSCFLILSLLFVKNAGAQIFNFTTTPSTFCYDGVNPVQIDVAVTSTGVATSFTFGVQSPVGCPQGNFVLTADPSTPNGSVTTGFQATCCGTYTVLGTGWLTGTPVTTNTRYPSGTCVSAFSITPSTPNGGLNSSDICSGQTATLDASGGMPPGTTYVWSTGATTSTIAVSPLANTCYTVTASLTAGCTMTTTQCINVQTPTLALSPISQTTCPNNTVFINATAISNSTGIQWIGPGPTNLGTSLTQSIVAPPSPPTSVVYTAVVTNFGPAGSCTAAATSTLHLSTFTSMTLTASSASVCPGAPFVLTANPASANSYSFGLVSPVTHSNAAGSNTITGYGPGTYTVNAAYGVNCPGSATVTVFTATLTPTLTASSASTCPGQNFTLTAVGGSSYTFVGHTGPASTATFGATNSTVSVITASTNYLAPANVFTVFASQGGCTGSGTLAIGQVTLHPTITLSGALHGSVCPSQTFALTGSGGINFTFTPPGGIPIGTVSANTATSAVPVGSFAATYGLHADSLGCIGNTVVTVGLLTLHPPLVASSSSMCPNGIFTLTASGAGNNTSGNGYTFVFNSPPSLTATPLPFATNQATSSVPQSSLFPATYTVAADSAGCTGTGTVAVGLLSLNNQIHVASIPTTGLVCPNNTFTLVATHAQSYNYTAPAGITINTLVTDPKQDTITSSIPAGPLPIIPNVVTYTVSGDSAGCIGSRTIAITQLFSYPHLTVSPSGSVCAGSSVSLTASSISGNTTTTSYTFAFTPPNIFPPTIIQTGTNNVAVHHPTAIVTTYSVIADSSGCTTSVPGTATIGLLPPLSLTLVASTPTVCSGQTDTLRVNSVSGYTYTWYSSSNPSVAIPTNPTDTAIIINPTVNTSYTVHAVNQGGCVGDAVINISTNPTASLTLSASASPSVLCPNQSSTITATGAVNYTWTPASYLNTTHSPVVVSSPSAPVTYTVRGDNGSGCAGAVTISVNVVPNPTVTISPTSNSVCTGYTSTLTANGAMSYTWTSDSLANPIYQPQVAVGPGTYSVVGSNGGSCINTTVITIGHAPPLVINVSQSSATTCIASNNPKYSQPVTFTASGGSFYSWLPYNPATVTYSIGPITSVIPPASTCYTVTGYTSVCSGSHVVCVTVIPQFTMNAVPPLPAMCVSDTLKLSVVNIGTNAAGPASAFTYSWTEPDDQILTLSNTLSPTVTAWPNATATYSVEMRDSRNCVSVPRLVTVTVYPRPVTSVAIPTINSVGVNTVCYVGLEGGTEDDVITLTAINNNTNLPFGVIPTYSWLPPSNYQLPNYYPILTPPNNNAVTVKAPLRAPSVVIYTVVSGYNGIPGCLRYDTVSVRVVDCRRVTNSKIKFTTDSQTGDTLCARQCVTYRSLVDTAAGGPQRLEWSFQGGNPSTSTDPFPTVCYNLPSDKNGYNVVLRVSNPYPISPDGVGGGSSGAAGIRGFIQVMDIPNVTIVSPGGLRSDTTVRFGQSVSLNGSGALSYQWYPPYNISSLTTPSVVVNPFQTTQYILNGYNSKQCFSSDTINVIVVQDCGEMYVPNAFSPNDDGHNDVLYVRGICLQSLTFMVFNRWGEKVFETTDQTVGWDGKFNGTAENTGVFVYRLEGKTYEGKGFSLKGNITLIR